MMEENYPRMKSFETTKMRSIFSYFTDNIKAAKSHLMVLDIYQIEFSKRDNKAIGNKTEMDFKTSRGNSYPESIKIDPICINKTELIR